jgi:hypothetical protein
MISALDRIDKATSRFGHQLVDIVGGSVSGEAYTMFKYMLDPHSKLGNLTEGLMQGPLTPDQIRERLDVVRSLTFTEFDRREEAIPYAYFSTLVWIFEHPRCTTDGKPLWSDFREWLRTPSDKIYQAWGG